MLRCVLCFSWFLCTSVELLAQAEARVYYNPFEWVGLAGGYSVTRWRYELNGSWHQEKETGFYEESYQDTDGQDVTLFENDVWTLRTTAITARVIRLGKKPRPWFGLYYGAYLRYVAKRDDLTERNWDALEEFLSNYEAVTSSYTDEICLGVLLGARGTIVGNVFWDANLALLPIRYSVNRFYYGDADWEATGELSYTYVTGNYFSHLVQVGVGYKFGTPKAE